MIFCLAVTPTFVHSGAARLLSSYELFSDMLNHPPHKMSGVWVPHCRCILYQWPLVNECEYVFVCCLCLCIFASDFASLIMYIYVCISFGLSWSMIVRTTVCLFVCVYVCACLCMCLFVYLLDCMSLFVSFKTVLIWNQACCQLLCKILSLITSIVCNFKMFQNQLMEECLKATQVFMLLSSSREESDPSTMLPMVFWENFNTTISSWG